MSSTHLMCLTWSSFPPSLLWWLPPEVTCDPPEWYFWSNSSNCLVGLIHFLTGCIFLRELKGFAQVEFLTGTGPLDCDIIQLKNQSMAFLSLWGTYTDSCVLFVTVTYPESTTLVWNFNNLKSFLVGAYYTGSLNRLKPPLKRRYWEKVSAREF